MKVIRIINQEISKLFEGVADTYGEKFGLPNPAKDMERKAIQGIKNLPKDPEAEPQADPKGELIGTVRAYEKESDIYANPKSLAEFDNNVRAVSTKKGDLFVIQFDISVYHSKLTQAVVLANREGRTNFYAFDEAYNLKENITWHRLGATNDFGYSISTVDNLRSDESLKPYVQESLDAVRAKNPQFNYIPMYWEKLLREGYDVKDMMQNNPYGFNNPGAKYRSIDLALEMFKTEKEYEPIRHYFNQIKHAWNLRELYNVVTNINNTVRNNHEWEAFQIFLHNIDLGMNYER